MCRPLLVTGLPRSGTTFAGKILSHPPHVFNIGEPFLHRVGASHLFPYYRTRTEEGTRYDDLLRSILAYEKIMQYRAKTLTWSISGLRRYLLGSRGTLEYLHAWWTTQLQNREGRLLLKEPHGLLLTLPALRDLGCQVLVLVRHPAGQVSSHLSLNWTGRHNRPSSLLDQPKLLQDHLDWLPDVLRNTERTPLQDLGLMWRALYEVFLNYLDELGETDRLKVIRHKDLCTSPINTFSELYRWAGLSWSTSVKNTIRTLTNPSNPTERSGSASPHPHNLQRDSASVATIWKDRLTRSQIENLRDITAPVASQFFDDEDWNV